MTFLLKPIQLVKDLVEHLVSDKTDAMESSRYVKNYALQPIFAFVMIWDVTY